MIYLGLHATGKADAIRQYVAAHKPRKIFVFAPERFPLRIETEAEVEYVAYTDIIMYKYFYRLLEEIDDQTLLVFNECLRTQNRNDLTYNCAHHYANQTRHTLVFEYFPFIEQPQDAMILLDLSNPGRFKRRGFSWEVLAEEGIHGNPVPVMVETMPISVTDRDIARYETLKAKLFDGLGTADPDTIPRKLHLFAGDLKKPYLRSECHYVARNARFKMPNINTYRDVGLGHYTIIDFPHRRLDFNDYLKHGGRHNVEFISSGLKVDQYYIRELKAWQERMAEFYAKTGLSN